MNSDAESLINTRTLQRLKASMEGIPGGFGRILDVYLEEAPRLWQRLIAAVELGDVANIRLYAHSLKSQCASMGAEQLARQFGDIEAHAKAEASGGWAVYLEQAGPLFDAVLKRLGQEREQSAPGTSDA